MVWNSECVTSAPSNDVVAKLVERARALPASEAPAIAGAVGDNLGEVLRALVSQDASREAMVEVAVRWVAEHPRVDRVFIDWADHDPDHWSHGRGPWISEFDGGLVAASPISEGADVTGAMVLWSQDGSDTIAASDARLILHRASVRSWCT